MEQIQEAITQVGRAIVASAKGIGLWQVYVPDDMEYHTSRPVDAKKARRRLLYRGLSQDRAGPKHQPFNYYAQVCESKEVSKYTAALTNCTQHLKEVPYLQLSSPRQNHTKCPAFYLFLFFSILELCGIYEYLEKIRISLESKQANPS